VQARTGPRGIATGTTGDTAYDIRIVAFVGARARTLLGLQELFVVDLATAERIVAGAPMVVRRAAPADEARSYAKALDGIGAQVVLEPARPESDQLPLVAARPLGRPNPPPPPFAAGARDDLPRPVVPVADSDLEFDVLAEGSLPPMSAMSGPPARDFGEQVSQAPKANAAARARSRVEEFVLSHDHESAIELDQVAASARHSLPTQSLRATQNGKTNPSQKFANESPTVANDVTPAASVQKRPQATMSRAAVVARGKPDAAASGARSVPLVRLLCAVLIAVIGVWLDNSILYGNATLFSVIAHGLGLQQLVLGIRGLVR
jgi:hypothetical protein